MYICNKILIRKPLVDISHIQLFWFPFIGPCKKKKNYTKFLLCKAPRLAFSFLPPVRFEIFTEGFSSWIFIFPLVHWLKKYNYSSLDDINFTSLLNSVSGMGRVRSSHRMCSVKIGALRDFASFTEKHLCWSLHLIKLQSFRPATLRKRASSTGVSQCNSRNTYFE